MRELSTPSVTLAQILAVVLAGLGLAAAFGLDISQDKQDAIVHFITVAFPIFVAADAVIRHGRSRSMSLPPKGEVAEPKVAAKPRKR